MRVLVCGSRHFAEMLDPRGQPTPEYDPKVVSLMYEFLDEKNKTLGPFSCVIEGEARGADTLARLWAESRNIEVERYPANWSKYGRGAGPIRNKQMLTEGKPDLVIAFYCKRKGKAGSVGTKNMVTQSQKAGLNVIEFEEQTKEK